VSDTDSAHWASIINYFYLLVLQCRLFHVLLFSQVLECEADLLVHSSDAMYRFEIIQSYYFIMWCILHEIMNSSVQSDMFCYRAVEFGLPIECAVLKPQILSNTIYEGIPY
jgi:hypothetical protein